MLGKEKRGQVTLFVIVGAIILLAAALVFFVSRQVTEDRPGVKEPEVSLEARPAMELIERCLEQTAKEALVNVGKRGGALTVSPVLAEPSYRGESVSFAPNTIPFWRYLANCDNPSGCEQSKQYPLCDPASDNCFGVLAGDNSIEEQLEEYVITHVDSCVNDFVGLNEVYNLEMIGEPSADVLFGNGKTTFTLSYPTRITSQSNADVKLVDDYITSFDVNLLGMYDVAQEIITFEKEYNYYERQTMNLVSYYSGIDSELLPPVAQMELVGTEELWVLPEVKEIMQYDVLPFMGLIRFSNMENAQRLYQKEDLGEYTLFAQGIYDMMFPATSNTPYPYEVTHHYLYEDIFFSINDGSMLIRPDDLLAGTPLFDVIKSFIPGLKDYSFKYHISYPLVIQIHDPEAFDGEGYDFQFAIEINVRNNEPAYQNFTYVDFSESLDISLGDYAFRPEQEITIATFDKLTGEPLEDVIISYVCGDEYVLGQTKKEGAKAILTTSMPYCELGGYIKYDAVAYLGESYPYDNYEGKSDQYFEFDLWPIVKKEVIILRRTPDILGGASNLGTDTIFSYASNAANLSDNQSVYFNTKRIKTSPYDEDVPQLSFLQYRVAPSVPLDIDLQLTSVQRLYENGDINKSVYNEVVESLLASADLTQDYAVEIPEHYYLELVPGNYSVEAHLIDDTSFTIPNATMAIDDGRWITFGDNNDVVELPELNLSSWPSGGAFLDFELTPTMLYTLTDRPLTFYVLEQPLPRNWSMLQEYQDPEEYQVGKERLVEPII
ncbi:hypothetical protein K9M74_00265 [Candidatus Woesearchaeota archaeon]|nr:hypothetical protein [Candidatus Woesearchaeota archaeon]